jgi:hypothetical protein
MPVYTVHAPVAAQGGHTMDATTDRYEFVRDGFYFWAMIAPVIWMLYHRLWLALVGYIVLSVAMGFVLSRLGVSSGTAFVAFGLISILIGLEAASLRRRKFSGRKWRQLDVVVADDEEAAERRFFDRHAGALAPSSATSWADRGPQQPSSPAQYQPQAASSANDIIGLFPQPGAPR